MDGGKTGGKTTWLSHVYGSGKPAPTGQHRAQRKDSRSRTSQAGSQAAEQCYVQSPLAACTSGCMLRESRSAAPHALYRSSSSGGTQARNIVAACASAHAHSVHPLDPMRDTFDATSACTLASAAPNDALFGCALSVDRCSAAGDSDDSGSCRVSAAGSDRSDALAQHSLEARTQSSASASSSSSMRSATRCVADSCVQRCRPTLQVDAR